MKPGSYIKWIGVVATFGLVLVACFILPRSRTLPAGYSYSHFPISGHRYLIAPDGIKKVGEEVISYEVRGSTIVGTVRVTLGSDSLQTFILDLKTHTVVMADQVQRSGD